MSEQEDFSFAEYQQTFFYNANGPIPVVIGQLEALLTEIVLSATAESKLPSYKLLVQGLGGLRVSILVAQAGASIQVPSILRHALESIVYANLFYHSPDWYSSWRDRHSSRSEKSKFRRHGLKEAKKALASTNLLESFDSLYDLLIDAGAHPNIMGVESSIAYQKIEGNKYIVENRLLSSQEDKNKSLYLIGLTYSVILSIAPNIWPDECAQLNTKQRLNYLFMKLSELETD